MIDIQISMGEACDRYSILHLKVERVRDPVKNAIAITQASRVNVAVRSALDRLPEAKAELVHGYLNALQETNGRLWRLENIVRTTPDTVEDGHRLHTYLKITKYNDRRAELKRKIDEVCEETPGEIKEHE